MVYRIPISRFVLVLVVLLVTVESARAQIGQRNRLYNPYTVQFQPEWNVALDGRVKLVDIQAFSHNTNSLVMLVSFGKDDPRRSLKVTHWDGFRFATDFSVDFLGRVIDTLLAGHFRDPKPPIAPQAPPPQGTRKTKQPAPSSVRQIITTEGAYEYNGTGFVRLFTAPPNIRAALTIDKIPEQLICNTGSDAYALELGDVDVHATQLIPPKDGGGFFRTGVGVLNPPDPKNDFHVGATFLQSWFSDRDKWVVCLIRGKAAPTPEAPNATTGDRLVVYTPVFGSRDKSFWATHSDDFEESWRSQPIAGRVLDVRVGDPQNEGKVGIVLLTAENDDKERHLSFFQAVYQLPGVR